MIAQLLRGAILAFVGAFWQNWWQRETCVPGGIAGRYLVF
jgi:hypothetical protein